MASPSTKDGHGDDVPLFLTPTPAAGGGGESAPNRGSPRPYTLPPMGSPFCAALGAGMARRWLPRGLQFWVPGSPQ